MALITENVGKVAFLKALLQAQGEVDPVHDADDDGLPRNQIAQPVQQLSVQNVRLFPAGRAQVKGGI